MPGYGFTCFAYDECRESLDRDTQLEAERDAAAAGWVLGLLADGDAQIACPYHAGSLLNSFPVDRMV